MVEGPGGAADTKKKGWSRRKRGGFRKSENESREKGIQLNHTSEQNPTNGEAVRKKSNKRKKDR